MAISKTEFKNAFREVVSSEFASIPADETLIPYAFSKKFYDRMDKLLRSQKKFYWAYVNTAAKRTALILALIISLLASACSIKSIREPIVSFLTDIYETYIRYLFEGETVDEITYKYTLKNVPDGYEQTEYIESALTIVTVYENENGDIIEFAQSITQSWENTIDHQHSVVYSKVISDIEIKIAETDGFKEALWLQNGYLLRISIFGNIDMQTLDEMIISIS